MRKSVWVLGAACIGVLAAFGPVLAQSTLTVHPNRGIPLPSYVTSSDDWLNPGNAIPTGRDPSNNYARLVEDPISNIVPVGPDLGPAPWQ
ncbi:hypothetical protein [Rhodoblastus sp.]|uniref:hypothetical protein n=1 Tax=Rhodoblastus sp. TaxID=1962975 RepID=UPI0026227809|nr:hypothetical protein [Rhodoblastus sp.]